MENKDLPIACTLTAPELLERHYWDRNGQLVSEYARVLQIDGPAWDIYLLYDRDAEWKDQPPSPTYWMDQLGIEKGTPFEGEKLAKQVRRLFETGPAKGAESR